MERHAYLAKYFVFDNKIKTATQISREYKAPNSLLCYERSHLCVHDMLNGPCKSEKPIVEC
jgi:hypothetical protein